MSKETITKIISAVAGLCLVGFGGWLILQDEGDHGGMLLMAGLAVIGGGLGTSLLPNAIGSKGPKSGGGGAAVLALVLGVATVATQGCAQTSAALAVLPKVRDGLATGARISCRTMDRVSRTAGGPWVVPRTAEEIAEDRAAGWFGEITGGGVATDATEGADEPDAEDPSGAAEGAEAQP